MRNNAHAERLQMNVVISQQHVDNNKKVNNEVNKEVINDVIDIKNNKKSVNLDPLDEMQKPHESELNKLNPIVVKYLRKYIDCFPDKLTGIEVPPHRQTIHRIHLTTNIPPRKRGLRPMTDCELSALREFLDENLATGFIRQSYSPYGAPLTFVDKKSEDKPRICIDCQKINEITIKNATAIPLPEHLFNRLKDAKLFTKLDLRSGYYQVLIHQDD